MRFTKRLEQDLVPEWRAKYVDYKTGKSLVDTIEQAALKVNASRLDTPDNFITKSKTFFDAQASTPRRNCQQDIRHGDDSQALNSAPWPMAVHSHGSEDTYRHPQAVREESYQTGDTRRFHGTEHPPSNSIQDPASITVTCGDDDDDEEEEEPRNPFYSTQPATGGSPENVLTRRQSTRPSENAILSEMLRLREQWFYNFMDKELDKVEEFYRTKEDEATKKLDQLRRQLHIMRDRRNQELGLAAKKDAAASDSRSDSGESAPLNRSTLSVSALSVNRLSFRRSPSPFSQTARRSSSAAMHSIENSSNVAEANNNNNSNEPWRDYTRRPFTPPHENERRNPPNNNAEGGAEEISFRSARRKLKTAFQEFYKSVELLKTYAELNRTAFRVLNRKADKAAALALASSLGSYPSSSPCAWFDAKVGRSRAYFVRSDKLERVTDQVEDLYARYFEEGNQKLAVAKLRRLKDRGPGDRSYSAFANGVMIGLGLTFWVEACIWAADEVNHDDEEISERAVYLLQVYAGYTLMLYLFWWFCFNCRTWSRAKINYPHIFEFDQRNNLDWRQLAAFPSFFTLLLGVIAWLNFLKVGGDAMFVYWPVILLILTAVIICNPLPVLRWKSRKWFMWTHVRLLLGGLLPVEFRDFFLGDQYVSLSYAVGNTELFFCLYATLWGEPEECSSLNSRGYGFISAIPAMLRATQCIRRFLDSGHWFPHLANMVKYMITVASLVALSFYRTDESPLTLTLFILFMVLNAVVAGIWDIFLDFSLLQKGSRNPYLRDILPLGQPGIYYGIMILDPILRFNWIILAFLTHSNYAALGSFIVAAIEITRRGLWTLLRVENEHSTNIGKEKAHRDVPLPYQLEEEDSLMKTSIVEEEGEQHQQGSNPDQSGRESAFELQPTTGAAAAAHHHSTSTGAADLETGLAHSGGAGLQRTGTIKKISRAISLAHCQDFERRRRPTMAMGGPRPHRNSRATVESDEDPYLSGSEASSDETEEIYRSYSSR